MGAVQGSLSNIDDNYMKKIYSAFSKFQRVGGVVTGLTPTELKLFLALVSFDGPDDGPIPNIEMTILHTTQANAQIEVLEILEQDGYKIDGINIVVIEIDGPFKAGFVISRNRIFRK